MSVVEAPVDVDTDPVARDDYGHPVVIQPGETWYSHPDGSISEDDDGSPSPGYVWVPDPSTGDGTWRVCPEHGEFCEDNGLEANCEHDGCTWRNRYLGYGLAPFEEALVAAPGDGISGAMVAAVPSAATAPTVDENVALPHVTLAYLGDDATLIDDTTRALIDAFVAEVAADEQPVTATVAGVGVMGKDNAVILLLNCQALQDAHDELQWGLETAGLCPPWSHDGFITHLSLAYPDDVPAAIVAAQSLVGQSIAFDALITCYGGEEHHFPLGAASSPSEAAPAVYADRGRYQPPTVGGYRGLFRRQEAP